MEPGSGRPTRRSSATAGAPSLLVDIQTVQGGFFGNRGIRRYSIGFARSLVSYSVVRALLLNPGSPWHEEFPADFRNAVEVAWSTRATLRDLTRDASAYVITSPFEQTSPVESAIPPIVFESGIPVVSVLYDLTPEIVDVYPPSLMRPYWARRKLLQDADLLLTLSEHVRRDAIARLDVDPERVAVVGAGASHFFRPRIPGEQPERVIAAHVPRINRPFTLSVTGWLPNKNAGGLIEAWSRLPGELRRRHQLVLTCPLPPGGETAWNHMAAGFGLAPDDVIVTDRVDDDVVRALYQQAELFVLPSYEEGFGLPVLEAARCGCPAITSSTSSLPEVLDWEPATFPPHDLDAMAAMIERGLIDSAFRADLRAVGDAAATLHTWDRVAERTIRACALMQPRRHPRRVPQPRVALVGNLSPAEHQHRGIDDVVTSMRRRFHVDCFDTAVDAQRRTTPATRDATAADGHSYPARALGQVFDPWGYDVLVYVVDRTPPREVVELARNHPGVVWFVDKPVDESAAAELARRAALIVRSPHVAALRVDAGPFGRVVPVTTITGEGGDATRAFTEAIDQRMSSVTLPES